MRTNILSLVIISFALSLLAACGGSGSSSGGGGGAGADFASYSFLGASNTLIENPYSDDPHISAELFTGGSGTRTYMVFKDNRSNIYYTRTVEITTPGTAEGTFPDVNLVYTSLTGTSFEAISSTVNITRYDSSVGGHIAGTFDAEMCDWTAVHYPGHTCTIATEHITGSFYVTKFNF